MRELRALAHFLDHLLRRHAHVGLAVLAARRNREGDLVRAGLERALEAFEVRRERNDLHAGDRSRELRRSRRCRPWPGSASAARTSRPRFPSARPRRARGSRPSSPRWASGDARSAARRAARLRRCGRLRFIACDSTCCDLDARRLRRRTRAAAGGEREHRPRASRPSRRARARSRRARAAPKNCPSCEACMTMPLPVPMCCGLRACTGSAGEDRRRDDAAEHEKASTQRIARGARQRGEQACRPRTARRSPRRR